MSVPAMLGGYPIEREIGRGGMGVVYLARDPRLNRPVAIKIVPAALAQQPDTLARFEREAKLLAAVSHPNIASVYGVEDADGQRLLVMEYVPGETLADRLAGGSMTVREAIDICRQVAAAIEAAHEGGIIHRDLKPGNIRLTPDGTVKVLDFGLAKGSIASNADLAQSPTLTYSPTVAGVILGTAGYMSPEQARGKVVDRRADVWAFGCVLYECLTRQRAFGGETVSDTIARILERDPDWSALPASTPPRVRELLARCLEKDLRRRQRDMGDVRIELDDIAASRGPISGVASATVEAVHAPERSSRLAIAAVALLVAGAAAGIGLWALFGGTARIPPAAPIGLSVTFPPGLTVAGGDFTRDGSGLIVRGSYRRPDGSEDPQGRLFRRSLSDFKLEPIAGTENLIGYVRSPDGRWLGVLKPVSDQSAEKRLWKVSIDGTTPPTPIIDWDPQWFDMIWLSDGDILTQTDQQTKYVRIPSGGGSPQPAIAFTGDPPPGYPRFFSELSNGDVLMQSQSWGARGYQEDICILDTRSGQAHRIVERAGAPRYFPDLGHLLFTRGSAILAARFDPATRVIGEPVALFDGLRSNSWNNGFYSVSRAGHLLFEPGGRLGLDRRIVIVNARREITPFAPDARSYESALSASWDGRQVAVTIPNARGTYETWVATIGVAGLRKVLSLPNADTSNAVWSPDGSWLAFNRNGRDKDDGIYVQRADGSGSPRVVVTIRSQDEAIGVVGWAREGLLTVRALGAKRDIFLTPVSASGEAGEPKLLLAPRDLQSGAVLAPDGSLLAYVSDDSGRTEISVVEVASGIVRGAPIVVTSGGGFEPTWSKDGKRLYFRQPPGRVMFMDIEKTGGVRASAPQLLVDLKSAGLDFNTWDILPDGRLVGIKLGEGEGDVMSFSVILNWLDSIRPNLGR